MAPLIEGLSDPAAGWEVVVGYLHSVPQLRMQVQTVTYSYLQPTLTGSASVQLREIRLPPSVLDRFGLPPHGRAQEVAGVWRRAAFGAQVQSSDWSYLAVDFEPGQRGLGTATLDMQALAEHLGNLGHVWTNVQVWVEGADDPSGNGVGTDRAISVRQHLIGLVGDSSAITWHEPTGHGIGVTRAPVPPAVNQRPQRVVIRWSVTPTPSPLDDAISEMSFGTSPEVVEHGGQNGDPLTPRPHLEAPDRPFHLAFDEKAKTLDQRQKDLIASFAADVVAEARRRVDDGGGLVVHVEGGGNGQRWALDGWPHSDRAKAVGQIRATETRNALEAEVRRLLAQREGPQPTVTFTDASRGRGLPDNNGTANDLESDEAARRVVVIRITDAEPASNRPLDIDFLISDRTDQPRVPDDGGVRAGTTGSDPQHVSGELSSGNSGDGWVLDADGKERWGRYGAAGLLLRARDADGAPVVLLQRRAQWSDQGGTWGLPGGARHRDETVVQAALRETIEETGLPGDRLGVRTQLVTARAPGIDWTYSTVIGDAPYPLRATSTGEGSHRWVRIDAVAELPLHPGLAESWEGLRAQMAAHPLAPARPSPQLDHTIDPSDVSGVYEIGNPDGAVYYRDDNDLLYREDTRPPEVIFAEGFAIHPDHRNTSKVSHFISTSRHPDLDYSKAPNLGYAKAKTTGRVFRYTIDAPGGVDAHNNHGKARRRQMVEVADQTVVGHVEVAVLTAPTSRLQLVMGSRPEARAALGGGE